MRNVSILIAAAVMACSSVAQATTVVIMIDPMTMEKHTRVFNTPGPDHMFMCVEPPGVAGCTEIPIKKRR